MAKGRIFNWILQLMDFHCLSTTTWGFRGSIKISIMFVEVLWRENVLLQGETKIYFVSGDT